MKIYGIKTCDTCRKAIKALETAGYHVLFHDIRVDPLEIETLQRFETAFGDAIVNTRSTTWRGLSEQERGRPSLDLLSQHPTLMKRPVIEADDLHLGWAKDVQAALI